ncbi:MAG: HAD family phosphatase [Nitrospirae bacterium]|nr:HAD family phosphatase [Nitrospirota bacterium]
MIGRNIFFDYDGTLIDSISTMFDIYIDYLNSLGIIGTRIEFDQLNGPSLNEIVSILKKRYNLKQSQSELIELYKTKISEQYKKGIKPFSDAQETLSKLKSLGKKLYLVTSNERQTVLDYIKSVNWTGFFTGYVFGDEVQRAKPYSDIYVEAIKKFGVENTDVIVIEDSINGVHSAKGAGLVVIGVTHEASREKLLDAQADEIVDKLSEIPLMFSL